MQIEWLPDGDNTQYNLQGGSSYAGPTSYVISEGASGSRGFASFDLQPSSESFQYIKTISQAPSSTDSFQYVKNYPIGPHQQSLPTAPQASMRSIVKPTDAENTAMEIRNRATSWAQSEGFTKDQIEEFDHMMGMVTSTHIHKHQLADMMEIDRGSFGKIFVSKLGGESVAVKQLGNFGSSTFKSKMRELLLELRVLVRVHHPNVVKFYGSATDFIHSRPGRQPYVGLVFEFCERGSLHKALFEDKTTRLSVGQKLSLCNQVSEGLGYLHSKRIIHRDLNTRNILLTADLRAKIADFGCARVMSTNSKVLKTTTISGSPAYMAPEQMAGQPLTAAVDVWALAIILWEVMMDTKPWEGRYGDFGSLKHAVLHGEKLHVPSSFHPFPSAFLHAITLGMQTRPEERPTMPVMQKDLSYADYTFNRANAW